MSNEPKPETLIGGNEKRAIIIVEYDRSWPAKYDEHAARIASALGSAALAIEHVGSTSVPGLAAKPIIDILVTVENSADEISYLPQMLAAGYVLRVREPHWHEHRMFRTPGLDVHVHFFSRGSTEIERTVNFRDHLRTNASDRRLYEDTKRELAQQDWPDMNAYANAKTEVIELILAAHCES